ncbi:MAG: hypothetical protein SGJ20_08150 [Planctomycetota bacterium]|nr:hypothetical protein [Planctomycetota bacterium]
MLDFLAYRTARSHIHAFTDESEGIFPGPHQAMECHECENFLQLGIDAFNWLTRADAENRKAIFSGRIEHDSQVDDAIDALYHAWLKPCGVAEKWIASQIGRGFELDNLEEFRKCVAEVRAIVSEDNEEVSGELADMRDQAIECHKRGESLEWESA